MMTDVSVSPTPVDGDTMRSVFAIVPSPVAVITVGSQNERYGATIGSLMSLSLDPPLIGFSMRRGSGLLQRLPTGARFGVSVLGGEQETTARDFAGNNLDRFARTRWCEEDDVPRIDEAAAWLVAEVSDRHVVGDHEIVVGFVTTAEAGKGRPLLFAERHFHAFAPQTTAEGGLA